MDLYQKVKEVIQNHIRENQSEVYKGKELMNKLNIFYHNVPA